MDLGWPEILLILVVVLIVFGAGKLPQIGSAMGKGIREFRKAQRGDDEEDSHSNAVVAAESKPVVTVAKTVTGEVAPTKQ
jgi:sec-independent protein translocase protein TatA